MERLIYLDNAATTAARPEVVQAMEPYFTELYGNPSSVYSFSQKSKAAVIQARETIARALNTQADNIYFTAGGTEADNWALVATYDLLGKNGGHIITTKVEHHAILHTCEYLKARGAEITYLDVDEYGRVSPEAVEAAIQPNTILISIMAANNEIGTIMPIAEIGAVAKKHNILFHTDAVQAFGQIPLDVEKMHIDMLSASGHKLNGPKGIGFLYIRKGVKIRSFIHGGAQERKRRAGTENVPGIVGLGKAVEMAVETMEERAEQEKAMRNHLIERVLKEIPYARLNGHPEERLPIRGGRGHADDAGCQGHLWLQRLGLHVRLSRPVSRASGHWPAPRDCPRLSAADLGVWQYYGGCGLHSGRAEGNFGNAAEHVSPVRGLCEKE